MDRFERLIDLGLRTEEATLITTPIHKLTIDQAKAGAFILDKRNKAVWALNKSYVPDMSHGPLVISKDGFEAFQNPCDTNVIISSEHQRQSEMQRHGCFDAREMVPHGKTSLLDGQL